MKIIGKKDSYKRGQTIGFGGVNLSWVNKMQVFVLENVKILGGVYRIEWNSFRGEKSFKKKMCWYRGWNGGGHPGQKNNKKMGKVRKRRIKI